MEPEYKLTYFNGNGRAALIRAVFSVAKIPFKDNQLNYEQWKLEKKSGKYEFEQMPLLEYKGESYTQSHAIFMFLAKQFKLVGKTLEDEYQIESLFGAFDDLFEAFERTVWNDKDKIEAAKKEAIEKYIVYLKALEKRFAKRGYGNYFLSQFSAADILICYLLTYFNEHFKAEKIAIENATKLMSLNGKLMKNEMKEFFSKYYLKNSEY